MGFIPKDARWYLADIILEHTIEDDPSNVVHVKPKEKLGVFAPIEAGTDAPNYMPQSVVELLEARLRGEEREDRA